MPEEYNLQEIQTKIKSLDSKVGELDKDKNEIISSIKHETKSGIKKWISYWIGGGILSLIIMYLTIYTLVITKSATHITNSIKEKFAEPKINQTLTEVEQNQAKQIIENNLNPAIQKANSSISEKIESFDKGLQEFKNKYDSQLKILAEEVEYLKKRNELLKLGDVAIATGDAAPFGELENIYNSVTADNINTLALSEVFRVKNHFATMTRIKGIKVKYIEPRTGKEFIENEIPTEALIQGLKETEPWQYRARIAELIKNRKEKKVPEALLGAIKNDKKLEVRKKAMDSFEAVTGFTSRDVFKYKPAEEWWNQNKRDVEKELKELQTTEAVLKEEISNNEN